MYIGINNPGINNRRMSTRSRSGFLAPSMLRRITNKRSPNGDDPYEMYSTDARFQLAKQFLFVNYGFRLDTVDAVDAVASIIDSLAADAKRSILHHMDTAPNPPQPVINNVPFGFLGM